VHIIAVIQKTLGSFCGTRRITAVKTLVIFRWPWTSGDELVFVLTIQQITRRIKQARRTRNIHRTAAVRTVQVVNAHDTQTKTRSLCSAGQWDCRRFYRQCLQIQLNQEISRIHFLNSGRFLRDMSYNIKMQVKFVMFEYLLFLSFSWHLPGRDANPSDPSDQGLKNSEISKHVRV